MNLRWGLKILGWGQPDIHLVYKKVIKFCTSITKWNTLKGGNKIFKEFKSYATPTSRTEAKLPKAWPLNNLKKSEQPPFMTITTDRVVYFRVLFNFVLGNYSLKFELLMGILFPKRISTQTVPTQIRIPLYNRIRITE